MVCHCRATRKGLLAAKAGYNECVTVSEEMLFSMHGLNPTLPVSCDFCPQKFHDFTEFDAHMVKHKYVTGLSIYTHVTFCVCYRSEVCGLYLTDLDASAVF